ncbi:MAG: GumC family protein [Opitutaceae bacterium]
MSNSAPHNTSSGSQIRIGDIINIVRQRWYLGLAIGLCASLVAGVSMMSKTPMYRTSASLVVEINPEKMIQLSEVVQGSENSRIYDTIINTYLERMSSRSMSNFVLESMSAEQLEVLRNAYPEKRILETESGKIIPELSGVLRKSTQAIWRPDAQMIFISAQHPNPEVAQALVNGYANALIQLQSNRQDLRTNRTLSFLDEQSKTLQARLEEGEAKLQEYRSENNLVSIEGSIDVVSQRLSQLNSALTTEKVRLIVTENQLSQFDAANGQLNKQLSIPFIANHARVSGFITRLEGLNYEHKALSKTYGRRHPIMIDLQSKIESLESSIELAVTEVETEVRKEYEIITTGYESLKEEMQATEKEALELDRLAIDYRVLERKLDVQRQIFDVVSTEFTNTDVSSQFDMTSISILDEAEVPGTPFEPDTKKALVISVFLFGAGFIGIPLVLELLDNRLKTFIDIEGYIGKPVFGDIKRIKDKKDSELAQGVLLNNDELSESFRGIYSSLKLFTEYKTPYSLIVSSALPSEGKTFIACNVAEVFSKHQLKVIIVDCDLRRPSVHRQFQLSNDKGVIEWVRSEHTLPPASQLVDSPELGIQQITNDLFVLASGGSTKDPTEIIGHSRLDQLISRLKEQFDVIIIDTPPVGLFPDASLLAEFAGQTLFVAKQNEVTRQKAKFAVNRLERTNAPVAGVVLNYIRGNSVASGYGYYGTNYSYGYGYERDNAKYQKYYETKES